MLVPYDDYAGAEAVLYLWGGTERLFIDVHYTAAPALPGAPVDPVYVEDPHAHSLSLEQAQVLHGALGYLLAIARESSQGLVQAKPFGGVAPLPTNPHLRRTHADVPERLRTDAN
jgi:hypothetical protein